MTGLLLVDVDVEGFMMIEARHIEDGVAHQEEAIAGNVREMTAPLMTTDSIVEQKIVMNGQGRTIDSEEINLLLDHTLLNLHPTYSTRDGRREPQSATSARRPDDSQHSSRPSSPPRAPEVPAFGSISVRPPQASTSSSGNTGQAWNVWKAPTTKEPSTQDQQTTQSSDQPTVIPPSAPKADLERQPPKAPKADRSHSERFLSTPSRESLIPPRTPTSVPVGPAMRTPEATSAPFSGVSPPTGPRQLSQPPTGPRQESLSRPTSSSGSNIPFVSSPAASSVAIPSGPRALNSANIPPAQQKTSGPIPTGPKATRMSQTHGRGATMSSFGSMWQRGSRSDVSESSRSIVVPSKRDIEGTPKDSVLDSGPNESAVRPRAVEATPTENNADPKPIDSVEGSSTLTQSEKEPQGHASISISKPPTSIDVVSQSSAERKQRNLVDPTTYDNLYDEDDDADDIDLDEDRFEKDKAALQSQKFDLGSRYLRGCTPMENIAFIGRLALEDFSGLFKPVEDSTAPSKSSTKVKSTSRPSEDLPTPEDESEQTEQERAPPPPPPVIIKRLTPSPVGSPQLKSLPFLRQEPLTPISDLEIYQENVSRHEANNQAISVELKALQDLRTQEETDLSQDYARLYRDWRLYCKELDQENVQQENQIQQEPLITTDEPQQQPLLENRLSPSVTTVSRRKNFATEHDIEQIIQASIETEKEEKARRDREYMGSKPDLDKEAVLPPLIPEDQIETRLFRDTTDIRDPADVVKLYELTPPMDNFTQQEHEAFAQNWKEFPKKFGKIAQGLPGRSYKDCINHYYRTKWNGQYKPPRDKRRTKVAKGPRIRSVAGRPKANALISNLGDVRPDVYDGEESNAPVVAVTDSGRPKRAAAPTLFREKEDEQSAKKKQQETSGDTDKPARKSRAAPKENKRRTKAQQQQQQVAPKRSTSPEKTVTESGLSEATRPAWKPRPIEQVHQQPAIAPPPLGGPPASFQDQSQMYPAQSRQVSPPSANPVAETGKLDSTPAPPKDRQTSSYWRVTEVNQFPELLKQHGQDFKSIAASMGTKTEQMCRNYFNKHFRVREPGDEPTSTATDQPTQTEPPRPPPSSGNSSSGGRRRTADTAQQQQPIIPRKLAPNPEVVEIEDDSPPNANQQSSYPPTNYSQPSTKSRNRTSSSARQTVKSTDINMSPYNQPVVLEDKRMSGGYPEVIKSEKSQYPPPPQQKQHPPPPTIIQHHPQQHSPQGEGLRRPEFGQSQQRPLQQQPPPRDHQWDPRPDVRGATVTTSSSRGALRVDSPPRYPVQPPQYGPAYVSNAPEMKSHEDSRTISRPQDSSAPPLKYMGDPPSQRPPATSFFDPARQGRLSPPHTAREEIRGPKRPATTLSQASPSQQQQSQPAPAAQIKSSKPETRKTSNLAAILNADEPDEAPSRSFISPAPPSRNRTPSTNYPSAYAPPRSISQPDRPELNREASRTYPAYPPPPQQPNSRPIHESSTSRDSLQSNTFRTNWPPRSFIQSQETVEGSPMEGIQRPVERGDRLMERRERPTERDDPPRRERFESYPFVERGHGRSMVDSPYQVTGEDGSRDYFAARPVVDQKRERFVDRPMERSVDRITDGRALNRSSETSTFSIPPTIQVRPDPPRERNHNHSRGPSISQIPPPHHVHHAQSQAVNAGPPPPSGPPPNQHPSRGGTPPRTMQPGFFHPGSSNPPIGLNTKSNGHARGHNGSAPAFAPVMARQEPVPPYQHRSASGQDHRMPPGPMMNEMRPDQRHHHHHHHHRTSMHGPHESESYDPVLMAQREDMQRRIDAERGRRM
ncbi:MAG: hypothetical protein M1831_006822 [Alyxoria varia]|nr:MAG: hypothetical protein M1831_006822 [Alyxoria varia]